MTHLLYLSQNNVKILKSSDYATLTTLSGRMCPSVNGYWHLMHSEGLAAVRRVLHSVQTHESTNSGHCSIEWELLAPANTQHDVLYIQCMRWCNATYCLDADPIHVAILIRYFVRISGLRSECRIQQVQPHRSVPFSQLFSVDGVLVVMAALVSNISSTVRVPISVPPAESKCTTSLLH